MALTRVLQVRYRYRVLQKPIIGAASAIVLPNEVSEAREEPAMILVVDERAAWGLNSASSQHILQTTYSQPMLSVRRASRTA